MSAEAVNGAPKSRAAMLEEQHALDEAHKATVEDVVDEEDLLHPPPSVQAVSEQASSAPSQASTPPVAKASVSSKNASGKPPALDVQSEELFPALGSGPKPKVPATSAWAAKGPSAAAALANGAPSGVSSGMSALTIDYGTGDRNMLLIVFSGCP
jgi:hypothetical protein